MDASDSKESATVGQCMAVVEHGDAEKRAVTRILYAHMFLNVSVLCLPIQARPVIFGQLTRGNAGRTAAILAQLTSTVGLA